MASVEFAALLEPISDAEACGPDLDAAGDSQFMSYMANAEGLLPQSFFAFDRKSVDLDAELAKGRALLNMTRDLRVLTLLAKFQVLNRDLEGFSRAVHVVSLLLHERWADVHPRPEGGDHGVRAAALESLDDLTVIVFPLQYLPLVESRRIGWISYRTVMIAAGEAAPRSGEQKLDEAAIRKELMDVEIAKLIEPRDHLSRVQAGLIRIGQTWAERAAGAQAIDLERVLPLVTKMLGFLDAIIAERDPNAAAAASTAPALPLANEAAGTLGATPARAEPGRLRSVADATAALAGVAAYFDRFEPSSPALLLVRQAEQLVGKSFVDVMRILVPASVDKANVRVGDKAFSLPLERLGALVAPVEAEAGAGRTASAAAAPQAVLPGGLEAAPMPPDAILSRSEAVAILEDVGAFYRSREPSSPIPLLTDRARSLVERDFLYLLEHLLLP